MSNPTVWGQQSFLWRYVWYRRYLTLRRSIKQIFWLGLVSVFLFEFFGEYAKLSFPQLEPIINIYTKFCYSLIAAIILYYFNIHWPSEEKKINTILYVSNRVFQIQIEAHRILEMLKIKDKPLQMKTFEKIKVEIQEVCDSLEDGVEIRDPMHIRYENWNTFFKNRGQYISSIINELLVFDSLLSPGVLESIVYIENDINTYGLGLRDNIVPRGEIKQYARFISNLYRNADHAATITRQKLKLYELEHHELFIDRDERLERERESFRAPIRKAHQELVDNGKVDVDSLT